MKNGEALVERRCNAISSWVQPGVRFARRNGKLEQAGLSGREKLSFGSTYRR
jgi:hypothetical protein